MTDATLTGDLDSTLATLRSDLTTVPPAQAVALLERWYHQLQDTPLGDRISELKQAILDGHSAAIGQLLSAIGEEVAAAKDVPSDVLPQVQEVGSLLAQAGKNLSRS